MLNAGLWIFLAKIWNHLAQLSVVMILARLLTPDEFGIVAVVQVILSLTQVIVQFGIGAALIQAKHLTQNAERSALTLMLSSALIMIVVLYYLSEWLGIMLNVPELPEVMPVVLATFFISAAMNPSASLLMREMRFKLLAGIDIVTFTIAYAVLAIVLAYAGYSYWSLIIATAFQTLLKAIAIFFARPVRPTIKFNGSELKPLLNFGGGIFLAQIMAHIGQRVDNMIVSAQLGSNALGFYSRAYSLADLANTLIGSTFKEALFSGFSKKRRQEGDSKNLAQTFLFAQSCAALIILPISGILFILSEEVVYLLLGEQWNTAGPILQVLSIGMYFGLAQKVSHSFNLVKGTVYQTAAINFIYAILVATGAYIGASHSLISVAYGVLIAIFVQFLLLTTIALKHCCKGWAHMALTLYPYFTATTVASLVSWEAHKWLQSQEYYFFAVICIVSFIFIATNATILFTFRNIGTVAHLWQIGRTQFRRPHR